MADRGSKLRRFSTSHPAMGPPRSTCNSPRPKPFSPPRAYIVCTGGSLAVVIRCKRILLYFAAAIIVYVAIEARSTVFERKDSITAVLK